MPIARLRACGTGASPARRFEQAIVSPRAARGTAPLGAAASASISVECRGHRVDVVGELGQERELAHARPRLRKVACGVELADEAFLELPASARTSRAARERRLVLVGERVARLFASLELSLQEVERQLRVRLAEPRRRR
jgi:hypothetical protein